MPKRLRTRTVSQKLLLKSAQWQRDCPRLSMIKRVIAVAAIAMGLTGCAASVGYGYNVYDPYYSDYHVWADPEPLYYNQWIIDNHRPYREFRRLPHEDQRRYWNWRHGPTAHPAPRPAGPPRRR